MPTNYPGAVDAFDRPVSNQPRNVAPTETASFDSLMDAVEAIETKVGTTATSGAQGAVIFADASGNFVGNNGILYFDPVAHRFIVGSQAGLGTSPVGAVTAISTEGASPFHAIVTTDSTTNLTVFNAHIEVSEALTDLFVPRFFRINVRDSGGTVREVLRHLFRRVGADDTYEYGMLTMVGGVLTERVTVTSTGHFQTRGKVYPGNHNATPQTSCGLFAGSGAPNNANGSDGDIFFRSNGGALTTIYHKRAGAWVGVV